MNEVQEVLFMVGECLNLLPIEDFDNQSLLTLYTSVSTVLDGIADNKDYSNEKLIAEQYFALLEQELVHRGLSVTQIKVIIDAQGNFISGRDELKQNWRSVDFDTMLQCVDEWLEQPLTDAQRDAVLDVAREIVMES